MSWKNPSKFRNATLKAEKREEFYPCSISPAQNAPISAGHLRFATTNSSGGISLYEYHDQSRKSTNIAAGQTVDLSFSPFVRSNRDEILVSSSDNEIKVYFLSSD
jgi:hypothetical protein